MSGKCALILAAGKGKRMGNDVNKIFLTLNNKPILAHTLNVFENCKDIDSIVLVAAKNEIEYCKNNIVSKYNIKKVKEIVEGGSERQESVYNGLKAIGSCNIVLIHDGARPFVSEKIISDGIKYAKVYGACACGVKPKDTIKVKNENGFSEETLNRDKLFCVQTPQCFKFDLILKAHENVILKKDRITDDTSAVELYGHKVFLYDGSYDNIKVTTPDDMAIGEKILKNK
ncbi:MAG: 2-C-methyl-D-erythritol 4-phosphate cytidylyltransferase [Clostridium sp.]|nr:2-C-methyl-D-erythritol 4-phosphate cytidylyltransferase [Clostridium sp.]